MLSQHLLFLTALLCLGSATPPTVPPQNLVPRDAVTDCQNLALGFNASCWDLIPRSIGMEAWLNQWNGTTTVCKPGELWANCFMREAGVPSNVTNPIRCDLIGIDVCPEPSTDVLEHASAEVSYGVVGIWCKHESRDLSCEKERGELISPAALQQYMTTLYQYLEGDEGLSLVDAIFLNQTGPISAKTILINILNDLGDPVATQLKIITESSVPIKQGGLIVPTLDQAQHIVGQTVGILLQWLMTDWIDGGFTALAIEGNLISLVVDVD